MEVKLLVANPYKNVGVREKRESLWVRFY